MARMTGTLALAAVLLAAGGMAQAGEAKAGGPGWKAVAGTHGVQRLVTPGVDRTALLIDDARRARDGLPPRFAQPLPQRFTPSAHGSWDEPAPGLRRWRLQIESPGAVSLNLGFGRYRLPEGATLRLFDANGALAMREFSAADNEAHGQLWTPIVAGNVLMLELRVPAAKAREVDLELSSINHGYRDFAQSAHDKSGACNIDVVCPQGDAWREPIRSVVALHYAGAINCSGAIVNNTAQDLKGYLLTANHCGIGSGNAATLVAYFNFENATCRSDATSGGAGNGPLTDFNSGAVLRATRAQSDFTLLELDDPIDPAFDVHWAGFDARDQATASAVAIHHPSGDEKRISFENQATSITSYNQNAVPGDGTHLRITDWDLGTTEPGSSGSPLFSPEQRIVGQLHGGGAACGNDASDWYGRLATSWATGSTSATRLRDWLDPVGGGANRVLDGRDAVEAPFAVSINPPSAMLCATANNAQFTVGVAALIPGFDDPVTLSASGVPDGLSVSISPNPRSPGQTATLTLSDLDEPAAGEHGFDVIGTRGADTDSARLSFTLVSGLPAAPAATDPANGANGVSPTALAWTAVPEAASYRVEVSASPAFDDPILDTVVAGTRVELPALAPETTYHWRIAAINACGTGARSAVASFTTNADYCLVPDLAIPDASALGASSTMTLTGTTPIAELEVVLQFEHPWAGDLRGRLSHAGVSDRTVFDPPANCSGRDPDVVLDDDAVLAIDDDCVSGNVPAYAPGTAYRPSQPLSAFDGHVLQGSWKLAVSDLDSPDAGVLKRWCLRPTFVLPAGSLFRDGFED